eukprot:s776_g19.t1
MQVASCISCLGVWREWTGPWSDESEEWTDARKEECGLKVKEDGAFWMEDKDLVHLTRCSAQYGRFGKDPPFSALARKTYQAREDNEITFKRGDKLEVSKSAGSSWLYGLHPASGKEGYFRRKDIDVRSDDTFKYELNLSNVSDDAQIVIALFKQNQLRRREFTERRDGLNYKDRYYPGAVLFVFAADGARLLRLEIDRHMRSGWYHFKASRGPFKIYVSFAAEKTVRFALYAFAPHGELRLSQYGAKPEGAGNDGNHGNDHGKDRGNDGNAAQEGGRINTEQFIAEVGERNDVENMRERIYNQTRETMGEYFRLGSSLLNDYPDLANSMMDVASTVQDMTSEGVQEAAEKVKNFVNSDQVRNVTSKVKEIINSDEAQELVDQVGGFMSRASNAASSWLG